MSTPAAFDPLASTYDAHFSRTKIGQYLRARVQKRLLTHFQAGDHLLELGCGTGEDALYLAQKGLHVTATDLSEEMLTITNKKTQHLPNVSIEQLDLQNLPPKQNQQFDGAFSNFGPLNCMSEWDSLSRWLAACIPANGIIGLGIMSPYCLWEIGWHALHLDFKIAFRRLRKSTVFQSNNNTTPITVHYPTIKHIQSDFEPYFKPTHIEPIGLFLPPSDVYPIIEKRPRLLKSLMSLEKRFGHHASLALFADHYWIEFVRL